MMAMETPAATRKGFWAYTDPEEALASYHFKLKPGKDEPEHELDAGIFLHGVCGIFALALADVFLYDIELAYEKPEPGEAMKEDLASCANRLVHIYCKKQVGEKTYYVDVRGIVENWETFYGTSFSDWDLGGRMGVPNADCTNLVAATMSAKEFDAYYHAAIEIILRSRDAYAV